MVHLRMDNKSQQNDEIEALKAIFEDQWSTETGSESYSMEINKNTKLFINLPPNYPSDSPPIYELLAPSLSSSEKQLVDEEFKKIYEENLGGPILFQWIDKLKEISSNSCTTKSIKESEPNITTNDEVISQAPSYELHKIASTVTHGSTIQDRKSVFQGHACPVNTHEDIKLFMDYLLENKKIAQATHNISAYRILLPNSTLLQDCDDDGETHAGGRMLHLLQILDVKNIMVVVSRWYGGIHLGPDRFKHINNAARQVLVEAGFVKQNN